MSTHFTFAATLVLAAVALAPVGAQDPKKETGKKSEAVMKADTDGWTSLFDGKTLNGWRGYNAPTAAKKKTDTSDTLWRVEDGLLTVQPSHEGDTKGHRDIITTGTYQEFDLRWEWKIAPGGNSGVKYFVLEDQPAAIGHEYQLIDDERHADAKIGPHRQTAALYDVFAAHDRPMKPAGQWNTSEVIVRGTHVEHLLNGKKVLEYELDSPEIRAAIAKSKFKEIARFGKPQNGHILLQDHGDQVWYRKIEIKKTK
jgi:3-keto-disaccharide hydrolase